MRPPATALLLFLVPMALGLWALPRLPLERLPRVNSPIVEIGVSFPGAAAEDVERDVTEVIEQSVSALSGVQLVTSTSGPGRANISMTFADDTDMPSTLAALERRLSAVRRRLPSGAGEPTISNASVDPLPIMGIALSSNRLTLRELHELANEQIAPQLQSVHGIADVSVSGGLRSEVQIRVDTGRLQGRGVNLAQVQAAVRNWNALSPAVTTRSDAGVFTTRTPAAAAQLSDLEELLVASTTTGLVHLKDVASVVETNDVRSTIYRLNQGEAIGLRITQQNGANALQVDAALKERLDDLVATYGPRLGVTATITNEPARLTRAALGDPPWNLFLPVMLMGLFVMVGFFSLRSALIALVALLAALLPTFFAMYLLGISINMVSLMALVLVSAILVDDAMVAIERGYRYRERGEPALAAARNALAEVGPATIASAIVVLVLFGSLAFHGGTAGRLFREFGLVAAIAAFSSLVVSLGLVPGLASRLLSGGQASPGAAGEGAGLAPLPLRLAESATERGSARGEAGREREAIAGRVRAGLLVGAGLRFGGRALRAGFQGMLLRVIRFRWLPLILGFAMFDFVLGAGFVNTEFVPREDANRFSLTVSLPPGTPIHVTDAATRIVEERLTLLSEVRTLATTVREQSAAIDVELIDRSARAWTAAQIANDVRDLGADVPNVQTRTSVPSLLGGGGGGDLDIVIRGLDLKELESIAIDVRRILVSTSGLGEPTTPALVPVPEYRAVVDPQRAADLGVSRQAVASVLNSALAGAQVSTFRRPDGSEVDVVVQLDRADYLTSSELGALPIQTSRGTTARLDQVATIVPATGLGEINRYDGARQLTIEVPITDLPPAEVVSALTTKLDGLRLPVGYDVRIVEESSPIRAALLGLAAAMAVSAALMFLILAQLFGSAVYPWAVVLCVPVSLVGALLGLRISGNTVNLFSAMGLVVLAALVAKQGIMLVDSANRLQKLGLSQREAILEASWTRARPILMSNLVMILALLPLASRAGAGAESRAPMAIAVIAGLIGSALLTLVMMPCAYTYLDDLQRALVRLGARLRGLPAAEAPVYPAASASGSDVRSEEASGHPGEVEVLGAEFDSPPISTRRR